MSQVTLWDGVYRHAAVPDWARHAFERLGPLRLLVLSGDWCGDAANAVPVLVRLAEAVPGVEVRQLDRDTYPQVMDRYLTGGSRSIPLVIGLDASYRELGRWGPRPAELQAWVLGHLHLPKAERYPAIRRWYAKDRGKTMLEELLAALGGERRPGD